MKNLIFIVLVVLMAGICRGAEEFEKIDVFNDCLDKLEPGTKLESKKFYKLSKDDAEIDVDVKLSGESIRTDEKKLFETEDYVPVLFTLEPAPANGFKIKIICSSPEKNSIYVVALKVLPDGNTLLLSKCGGERQIKPDEERDLMFDISAEICKDVDKMMIMIYNLGRKKMVLREINIICPVKGKNE